MSDYEEMAKSLRETIAKTLDEDKRCVELLESRDLLSDLMDRTKELVLHHADHIYDAGFNRAAAMLGSQLTSRGGRVMTNEMACQEIIEGLNV